MTTASSHELRKLWDAAKPLIEQQMDLADMVADIRKDATEKGFDWSQIKALLKAEIQDGRDEEGGERFLRRLLEKADNATAYADMLGITPESVNQNNFSSDESAAPQDTTRPGAAEGGTGAAAPPRSPRPNAPVPSTDHDSRAKTLDNPDDQDRADERSAPTADAGADEGVSRASVSAGQGRLGGAFAAAYNAVEAPSADHQSGAPAPDGSAPFPGDASAAEEGAASPTTAPSIPPLSRAAAARIAEADQVMGKIPAFLDKRESEAAKAAE